MSVFSVQFRDQLRFVLLVFFTVLFSYNIINLSSAWAGVEGSVSGTIVDEAGITVSQAQVKLLDQDGKVISESRSSPTGDFQFFPIPIGDYSVEVKAEGKQAYG